MNMQRRHFEFIAETIQQMTPKARYEAAGMFAARLANTNPNFNKERFYGVAFGLDKDKERQDAVRSELAHLFSE